MTDCSATDRAMRQGLLIPHAVSPRLWTIALYACLVAAGAAGLYVGAAASGAQDAVEPNLILLLRFMAALKAVCAIAAALLVHWRLMRPIAPRLAGAYGAAVAAMAFAPGLIWSLSHIGLAAATFHIGLLSFLVLAYRDGNVLPRRAG